MKQMSSKLQPLALEAPTLHASWFQEPLLLFGNGQTHVDPKVGIPLYGPRSLNTQRHKSEVHVGLIGTSQAVAGKI